MQIKPGGKIKDFAALEARRLEAARLFAKGYSQAEVARTLGVSAMSVCRWYGAWREGGRQALRTQTHPGSPSRLNKRQLHRLERELLKGPQAHGYATQLWTLPRIAKLIEKLFGIRYHPGHVWYLLRRMGWTTHRPARQAKERDEAAISRWLNEAWPRIKKGR
jgi:transposase